MRTSWLHCTLTFHLHVTLSRRMGTPLLSRPFCYFIHNHPSICNYNSIKDQVEKHRSIIQDKNKFKYLDATRVVTFIHTIHLYEFFG